MSCTDSKLSCSLARVNTGLSWRSSRSQAARSCWVPTASQPPVTTGHSNGVERSWGSLPVPWLCSYKAHSALQPHSRYNHHDVLLTPMFPQMQLCCWHRVAIAGVDISLQSWNTPLGTGHGSFPHVYLSALGLRSIPVSSITVLVKCTAGTFWLNFLTGHYDFSERKSHICITNYIPHKPIALSCCKLPTSAIPRHETVTEEEKMFLMAVLSDDSCPFPSLILSLLHQVQVKIN